MTDSSSGVFWLQCFVFSPRSISLTPNTRCDSLFASGAQAVPHESSVFPAFVTEWGASVDRSYTPGLRTISK